LQNKELVKELKDRNETHARRIEDLKTQAKSELIAEQEKCEQLQQEIETIKEQNEDMKK
jgi:hypothetical protein